MSFLTNGPAPKPEPQVEPPELTCSQGKCEFKHPLHCCHFARTRRMAVPKRPGWVYIFWMCEDCGKRSRTLLMVRET